MTHIRRATVLDAPALAEIAARTFADTFGADNTPDDMALFLATAYGVKQQSAEIENSSMDSLLLEIEGALAGFTQLRVGPAPECVAGVSPVEIYRFYVDRLWHGRGFAQALMRAAEDVARTRNADALWLSVWEHNPRAQAFYAKCGFARVGTKAFVVGTDVQTDWVMARPFSAT